MRTPFVFALGALLAQVAPFASDASAQCTLLVRESFRLGERPHGGNGRPRDAQIHDTLKDYWPQTPSTGASWIAGDQGVPGRWAFAASSLDPAEVDPLDPYNGTAFGEPGAAALLPFSPPTTAFTISAEAVMLSGSTSTTYLGYTSNPAVLDNFDAFGTLWLTLDGQGHWSIRANASQVVASGTAQIAGTFLSGWLHMELTYDPRSATVSGRVMNTPIAPTPVMLTHPFSYVGMEARESWNVLNNLALFTGTPLSVSIAGPPSACPGATLAFTAATNAGAPFVAFWQRDGLVLSDGPTPTGSVISGANSLALTISNASPADSGRYECWISNACGIAAANAIDASVRSCCVADMDDGSGAGTPDGGVTIDDLLFFLAQFEAGHIRADVDNGTFTGTPDGGVTIDDLLYYLLRFENGC